MEVYFNKLLDLTLDCWEKQYQKRYPFVTSVGFVYYMFKHLEVGDHNFR